MIDPRDNTFEITGLGILTVGKVLGATYALLGVILGAIFTLVALAGGGGGNALFGLGAIIFVPLVYGVGGFIGGILTAAIYNFVAGKIGGIVIETKAGHQS